MIAGGFQYTGAAVNFTCTYVRFPWQVVISTLGRSRYLRILVFRGNFNNFARRLEKFRLNRFHFTKFTYPLYPSDPFLSSLRVSSS